MVVAYCRPFAVSKGQKNKFPTRLLQLDSEEKALHQGLLKLRNQVYAHTDVALRAVRPIRLNNRPTAIEALPPMRFSDEQLKAILRIMRSTSQNIQARLEVLSPSLAPPE